MLLSSSVVRRRKWCQLDEKWLIIWGKFGEFVGTGGASGHLWPWQDVLDNDVVVPSDRDLSTDVSPPLIFALAVGRT